MMPPETSKPWLAAVREAMRASAAVETEKRHFDYRWEHVTAVVTLATKLAHLTHADTDIVVAAAWLHDIRKEAGHTHPQEGAAFARTFLPQTDFPAHKIEAVAQAIADHMGLWRDEPLVSLESQVLWDADKLAKLGLTAAFHWTGWGISSEPQTISALINKSLNQSWMDKTVASMHTEPARRAARARLVSYHQLWLDLEMELNGDDLE